MLIRGVTIANGSSIVRRETADTSRFVGDSWASYKLCSHHSTKHCRACVQDGAVIDKVMIIKDKHGAGLYNCHKQSEPNVFKPTFHDVDQLPINPDRL